MTDVIRVEKKEFDDGLVQNLYFENDILVREEWLRNGKLDRSNKLDFKSCNSPSKPAWIEYYKNENENETRKIKEERWYVDGKFFRENGLPSQVVYYYEYNTNIMSESWYNYGESHPSIVIEYLLNGSKERESYYKNGKRHREYDLPAFIAYSESGKKNYESWFVNGKQHREGNLPTHIVYNKKGVKIDEAWIKNDVLIKVCKYY